MQNEPVVHDTHYGPERSAGPDNAYYLRHCPEIERGPAYTACLSRLHDLDGGRTNERTAECAKALRENRCVAAGMREQEKLAGKALFYFPRTNKPFLPVSVAGDFGVLITNLTDPALIPKPARPFGEKIGAVGAKLATQIGKPIEKELQVDALAAAISNAAAAPAPEEPATTAAPMSMEQVKEVVAAIPPENLPPLPPKAPPGAGSTENKIQPGETPLQFARRMAALRNAKPT